VVFLEHNHINGLHTFYKHTVNITIMSKFLAVIELLVRSFEVISALSNS